MMLQHRRTAAKASDLNHRGKVVAVSSSPSTSSNGGKRLRASDKKRRKKYRSSSSLTTLLVIAMVSFLIIFTAITIVFQHLGHGTSSSHNDSNNVYRDRFLRNNIQEADGVNNNNDDGVKRREARYQSLYRPKFDQNHLGYDIYNCPATPPPGYPMAWKTTEVLTNWMPHDVTTIAPNYREIYQGLCVFDYQSQYDIALNYRNAEMPFIIRNDPNVMSVAKRWEEDTEYLHKKLGDQERFRTERSPINEFMWYRLHGQRMPRGYVKPPNDEVGMTYGEWLELALAKDAAALQDPDLFAKVAAMKKKRMEIVADKEQHDIDLSEENDDDKQLEDESTEEEKLKNWYYFRLTTSLRLASKGGEEFSSEKFVYDELPFFDPRKRSKSQFYIVDPEEERGINCRFGMRGVISANHFDMSRNFIMIFGGERRYVLGHPNQCKNMALFPHGHPSLRHSEVDWNNPLDWDEHPEFKQTLVNEVVLHAGDALYLPTAYFHFIVNLSLNYQCNARSGTTYENAKHIQDCGFNMG